MLCLVPPSPQAYLADSLSLKHPFFATLSQGRKPGGLPALLCLYLPVNDNEEQLKSPNIPSAGEASTFMDIVVKKGRLVVVLGVHAFTFGLSESFSFLSNFVF